MLANPVVIPSYADPIIWAFALLAMCFEVWVVLQLLRRMHQNVKGLSGPLGVINLTTWFPFLVAMDHIVPAHGPAMTATIVALELAIVGIEAILIHALMRGRFFARGLSCRPISWRDALRVSFLGNLASVAMSIAVPLLVVTILA